MGINKLKVVLTEEAQTFWDTEEETLVIATHGIVKKTQKAPLKEIAKAEEIRKVLYSSAIEYYTPFAKYIHLSFPDFA